jgi:hypothetical protein
MSDTEQVVYLPCDVESIDADPRYILVSTVPPTHPVAIWVSRDKVVIDKQPAPPHRNNPLKGWVKGRVLFRSDEWVQVELEDNGRTQLGVFPANIVRDDIGLQQATTNPA